MSLNMQYHHTLFNEMFKAGLLKWQVTSDKLKNIITQGGKGVVGHADAAIADGFPKVVASGADPAVPSNWKPNVDMYKSWTDLKVKSEPSWIFPTLVEQKEFVSELVARNGLRRFVKDVDVIAIQEGFVPAENTRDLPNAAGLISTEQIMSLLGFRKVVCSSSQDLLPEGSHAAAASVRDMVYDSPMWINAATCTHPLPKEVLEGKLVNQIYARRGSKWVPNGKNLIEVTSTHFQMSGGSKTDVDCDGKDLAPRSVVSSELVCNKQIVRALSTHVSGGRFEDQYWHGGMRDERHQQLVKIGELVDRQPAKIVSVLAGDYNACMYDSTAMKNYAGLVPRGKEDLEGFLGYMKSALVACWEQGFSFSYYDAKDPSIKLDQFGSVIAPSVIDRVDRFLASTDGTPFMRDNTSSFGHIIDWFAVKDQTENQAGVIAGSPRRIVLTTQSPFSLDKSGIDNAVVNSAGRSLTDHNAVKQSFTIGDQPLIAEADIYDLADVSRSEMPEVVSKLIGSARKVAYIGSPFNLGAGDNRGVIAPGNWMDVLTKILGSVRTAGATVHVGGPNDVLRTREEGEFCATAASLVATPDEYSVLLTPGGPGGVLREAAQFRRSGCRIIALTDSANAQGTPDWYNMSLSEAEALYLKAPKDNRVSLLESRIAELEDAYTRFLGSVSVLGNAQVATKCAHDAATAAKKLADSNKQALDSQHKELEGRFALLEEKVASQTRPVFLPADRVSAATRTLLHE